MKRYEINTICIKCRNWLSNNVHEVIHGKWIKYTDHETEIKRLKEQNREMLEMLKSTYAVVKCNKILEIDPAWLKEHKEIIEKIEKENIDG